MLAETATKNSWKSFERPQLKQQAGSVVWPWACHLTGTFFTTGGLPYKKRSRPLIKKLIMKIELKQHAWNRAHVTWILLMKETPAEQEPQVTEKHSKSFNIPVTPKLTRDSTLQLRKPSPTQPHIHNVCAKAIPHIFWSREENREWLNSI